MQLVAKHLDVVCKTGCTPHRYAGVDAEELPVFVPLPPQPSVSHFFQPVPSRRNLNLRKLQSGPNGPRIYWALPTSNFRKYTFPALLCSRLLEVSAYL